MGFNSAFKGLNAFPFYRCFFFNTRFTCYIPLFTSFFFCLSFFLFQFSKFFFFSFEIELFIFCMLLKSHPVFLFDLFGVFGHYKAPWMGEVCLPVFRSCMCGCSCARIYIQSAWSNLCHVKVKCLIVCFSLLLTYIS